MGGREGGRERGREGGREGGWEGGRVGVFSINVHVRETACTIVPTCLY